MHRLFFYLTGCYTGRCGTLYVHLKPDTILIGQNRDKNSRAKKVDLQALILTKKNKLYIWKLKELSEHKKDRLP